MILDAQSVRQRSAQVGSPGASASLAAAARLASLGAGVPPSPLWRRRAVAVLQRGRGQRLAGFPARRPLPPFCFLPPGRYAARWTGKLKHFQSGVIDQSCGLVRCAIGWLPVVVRSRGDYPLTIQLRISVSCTAMRCNAFLFSNPVKGGESRCSAVRGARANSWEGPAQCFWLIQAPFGSMVETVQVQQSLSGLHASCLTACVSQKAPAPPRPPCAHYKPASFQGVCIAIMGPRTGGTACGVQPLTAEQRRRSDFR